MKAQYVTLRGKDNEVKINTTYIVAYTYDKELDETVVWLLGRPEGVSYPGDQRKEISFAIMTV